MMTEVEAGAEYPRALYHYTTQTGLTGILRDRVAWATNVCYMNDAREFNYARELLHEAAASFQHAAGEQFAGTLPFLRPPTWDVYPDVFAFSLAEHADRLGLWQAYSGGSTGYSIGFSTVELVATAEEAGFRLVKCSYDKSEQQKLVLDLLEETRATVNRLPPAALPILEHSVTANFWNAFAILAARIKHPSFAEESEWRFVSDGMQVPRTIDGKELRESKGWVLEPRQIRVRVGPSTLIPFVEMPLAGNDERMPIYHIRVGPSIDPPRAAHAVQTLLFSCNQHSQKSVHPSTIPYRTW
jgi:hypothetical protein